MQPRLPAPLVHVQDQLEGGGQHQQPHLVHILEVHHGILVLEVITHGEHDVVLELEKAVERGGERGVRKVVDKVVKG